MRVRTLGCRTSLVICLCLTAAAAARAQDAAEVPGTAVTLLPHADDTRWWVSGQINLIGQEHGTFSSPYSGPHSLKASPERAVSRVLTLYTGWQVSDRLEVLVDLESAGGRGISDAFGLAGFTNLDVVRNPSLGSSPYLARAMIRWIIPLSHDLVETPRGPLGLATKVPGRRLEIRAGKLGIVDFFDLNSVGSDSHLQFTNWVVDNNGAYDYAADTRGYTVGIVAELIAPRWTLRGAEALMPKVANGIDLDFDPARAGEQVVEFESRPTPRLTSRTLAYLNRADMGSYREAIAAFQNGASGEPDIEAERAQGRHKAGVGENVEYALPGAVRLFARAGWNDGRNESFAYTEVDHTIEGGGDVQGQAWKRPTDRFGIAMVSSGLSDEHRRYLELGGLGFLLGDGTLRYGRENIIEGYYTAHIWSGVFGSLDLQRIDNPGYNRDRGPVVVGTVRLHLDF